jgi:dTDP-4-dehydrorhamnose reductase
LQVVEDQWGSPTYTRDLAGGLWEAALEEFTGVVHLTNGGVASWADLAEEVVRSAGLGEVRVERVPAATWPSPTRRPRFSPLDNAHWRALGFSPLRSWAEAVQEYVNNYLQVAD